MNAGLLFCVISAEIIEEILNPKHEIRNKNKIRMTEIQNVFNIRILVIRICFEFRYSDFEFFL